MLFFTFYRLYIAICGGVACWLLVGKSVPLSVLAAVAVRAVWFGVERFADRMAVENDFKRHAYEFKQQLGPYGIRIANQAEKDFAVKQSLAEVFVKRPARLRKNVEQLAMLDTLFSAGMRPEGDAWLLHDCKLKYGRFRLERMDKGGA
jgi:hypothetical protein